MNIAIVGSGVAAMAAAFHLHQGGHEITVFEAQGRVGGHTHTHAVEEVGAGGAGTLAIDSGFIVFNPESYPNFVELLHNLRVETQPTSMSLSVTDPTSGLSWSSECPITRWIHAFNPRLWSMLMQLPRFHTQARDLIRSDDDALTVEAFARRARLTNAFLELYLLPMGAAVWSSPLSEFRSFPALFLVQFMQNHQMLRVKGRPDWRTVIGGSAQYMDRLTASFMHRVRLGEPVLRVRRTGHKVRVDTAQRAGLSYDRVVLGCHCDQALRVLENPDQKETRVLGSIGYQTNHAVLHKDVSQLPGPRKAWSSWNVRLPSTPKSLVPTTPTTPATPATPATPEPHRPVSVTYWMNRLQNLKCRDDYCVTLNPTEPIEPSKVIAEMTYEHPRFGPERRDCHAGLADVQGRGGVWYCGAWCGWGFHEDAVRSGLRVARGLGCDAPILETPHAP